MGKASRWLKSLLGMKRDVKETPTPPNKDKRRWSFTHSTRTDSAPPPRRRISLNIPPKYYLSEKDANQAVAVAAATAAAAEAAVAAAHAAMVVVRLTNQGRSGRDRRWAALKIQTAFRGYLARKALKALKGLVKLQAHVRGYLVRKRATNTLHSMQALIRAQSTARAARLSTAKPPLQTQPRMSEPEERFDESRTEIHSKRMLDPCYDDTAKIVEIDTYYNKPKSHRPNNYAYTSEYDDMYAFPISGPIVGPFLTPAKLSVPPNRHYEIEWGSYDNDDRQFRLQRRASSTAYSTPRFANWVDGPFTPVKPVCDEGPFRQYRQPHRLSGSYDHPNYMVSTQSFEAKSRSQSVPKQRPAQPSPSKKRMSLEKVMECRHSLSGVRMHTSYSEDTEASHF